MGDMKIGSDKQITAVTQNLKEDQVLEKTMQMLDLEESYAIKLLELDHRIVKVNYKRLKNKVGKIKSHLTPEQVAEIRSLEHEGKLDQGYTSINLSGAIKIAAAAKRLKLGVGMPPRPKPPGLPTAPPPSTAQSRKKKLRASQWERKQSNALLTDAEPERRRRSNSVTGVFIDAPSGGMERQRSNSIANVLITDGSQSEYRADKTAASGRIQIRDGELDNISEVASSLTSSNANKLRATTAQPYTRDGSKGNIKLKRPQTSNALITRLNKSNFSSHAEDSNASNSPTRRSRTAAIASNFYEIGNNHDNNDTFGEDPYEQRRKDLLKLENSRHGGFEERKNTFMKRIEEYISDKPFPDPLKNWDIIRFLRSQDTFIRANDSENLGNDLNTSGRRKRFKFPGYGAKDADDTAADVLDSWKSQMRKIRYLRIPEDMIDTSGVNTLAKDQLRQQASLKSNAKGGRGFQRLAAVND